MQAMATRLLLQSLITFARSRSKMTISAVRAIIVIESATGGLTCLLLLKDRVNAIRGCHGVAKINECACQASLEEFSSVLSMPVIFCKRTSSMSEQLANYCGRSLRNTWALDQLELVKIDWIETWSFPQRYIFPISSAGRLS